MVRVPSTPIPARPQPVTFLDHVRAWLDTPAPVHERGERGHIEVSRWPTSGGIGPTKSGCEPAGPVRPRPPAAHQRSERPAPARER